MNIESNTIRLLGVAQLVVFAASFISERLLSSTLGSGGIVDILVNISKNLNRIRTSNLVALLNSLSIVVLGVLFYLALNKQNKTIALVALGFFLAEAITLAVSKIGTYALIPLSQEFAEAGAPQQSYYQTLGNFLYFGVDRRGYDLHMLFFCLGAILWYYLLYRSRYIPLALSGWGLVAISLVLIPVVLVLYNRNFTQLMILALPYAPFELVLGIWLIVKGFN